MVRFILSIVVLLIPILNITGSGIPTQRTEDYNQLYTTLQLQEKGLANEVYQLALKGHERLAASNKLKKLGILTIVDLSQSSKNKRFYVIDLEHGTLLFNTLVAHGRNTGDEYAEHFSNVIGSFQSSLGFYVTDKEEMRSTVGLSMVLEGMEAGFNDKAKERQIIMHGADYATEDFIRQHGRLGRSFGCPSLPPDLIKPVVETIKDGTCLFIYYPDQAYISHSKLLL